VVDGSTNDSLVLSPDTGYWVNAGTVSNGISNFNVYQNLATNSQVLVKSGVVVTNNDPNVAPVFASTSATAVSGLLPTPTTWTRNATYGTSTTGGVSTTISATGDVTPTLTYTANGATHMWLGDKNSTEVLNVSFGTPLYQVQVEFSALNFDASNKEQLSFKVNGVDLVLSSANLSTVTYPDNVTANPSVVAGNFITATNNLVTGGLYDIISSTAINSLTVTSSFVSGTPSGVGVAIKYSTGAQVAGVGAPISALMPAATDADGSVVGYAITSAATETGADATPGSWQYFNGSTWTSSNQAHRRAVTTVAICCANRP
jgi:hypothetical protein